MTAAKRTLVLGADGQLGRAFCALLPDATGWTERDFDLRDPAGTARRLAAFAPAVIINCAAVTDVDGCERDPVAALRINVLGLQPLAQWSRDSGCQLVHFSTDYVFPGDATSPYGEEDAPAPLNVYGVSKWLSERWVLPGALVVRSSLLLGESEHSFHRKVMHWSQDRDEIAVVDDLVASPTVANDLAAAVLRLLEMDKRGLVNIANAGFCSRAALARVVLSAAGCRVRVRAARQRDFPELPARRPRMSALGLARLQSWGVTMRPWQEAVAALMGAEALRRRDVG